MASGTKRFLETELDGNPSKRQKTIPTAPSRAFQHIWLNLYDWLEYDKISKNMFCKLCIKIQKTNSFTSGCTTMKKDNLTKHEKSKGN